MYHVDVYIIIMARPSTPTKDMKELYPGSPTIGTPGHSSSNPVPDDEHVEILGFRQIDMTSAKKLKSKIGVRGRVEKTATLGTIPHAANNKPVNFFAINICDDVCNTDYSCLCHRMVTRFACPDLMSTQNGTQASQQDPLFVSKTLS